MPETNKLNAPIYNRLLAALPTAAYMRLSSKLEQTDLVYGKTIYERGEIIRHVYFPNSGIISLLLAAENDATIEVGIIGKEGIAGLSVFLGVKTSNNQAVVQGAGSAMRMRTMDFLAEIGNESAFPRLLQRFTHTLLAQASQSAACYCFHLSEARLARWLLMTSERLETGEFPVTQKFLSNMLGVRREAVSKSAAMLQQQRLISYSRGKVSIIDQAGLKKAACMCYSIIKDEEKSFPFNGKQ